MTAKSRTIDNLGIEASIRYAQDQQLAETRFLEDSLLVAQKSEVSVSKPYTPSEFDPLFSVGKTLSWASFLPPPDVLFSPRSLFSYQLIPSLGGYEKQEADEDKLAALEDALEKHRGSKDRGSEKEKDEEEKERQVIAALLQCIHRLDRTLTLINSRRNQYQRG